MRKLRLLFLLLIFLESTASGHEATTIEKKENDDLSKFLSDFTYGVATALSSIAMSAEEVQPKLDINVPLEPLVGLAPLKYVHEGDLLKLKLQMDNVTLHGLASLSIQQLRFSEFSAVSTQSDDPTESPLHNRTTIWKHRQHANGGGRRSRKRKMEDVDHSESPESSNPYYNTDSLPAGHESKHRHSKSAKRLVLTSRPRKTIITKSEEESIPTFQGIVQILFKNLRMNCHYAIKGSAGGVFTFKESGWLNLTSHRVLLSTNVNFSLPMFSHHERTARHNHIHISSLRTSLSISTPKLSLHPDAQPPEWVRKEVTQKLEDLAHGVGRSHGAIRHLLKRWGHLLRRILTKTARVHSKDFLNPISRYERLIADRQ